MRKDLAASFLATILALGSAVPAHGGMEDWSHGGASGRAYVCTPGGEGPFPVVVFNHGRIVDTSGYLDALRRGYDLKGLCWALAEEGFLGFFPIRTSGRGNIPGHGDEVESALAATRTWPGADPGRLALAGFSRGGLLALMAAVRRAEVGAVVLLAPAPGRGQFNRALGAVGRIEAPLLAMVEADDSAEIRAGVDALEAAMLAAGNPAEVIRYDRGGGHKLFYRVGYYWGDLIGFLNRHLGPRE